MKYWYPPLVVVLIGPHTYVCMSSGKSEAFLGKPKKDILVILPSKQASHVS
jgi:hypothetical protein